MRIAITGGTGFVGQALVPGRDCVDWESTANGRGRGSRP